MAFTITIEVEGGKQTAKIKDDTGNEYIVDGLALFATSETQTGNLYVFGWGSPKDAALAVGEGLARAGHDPFYQDFYKCLLMQMVMRTGEKPNREEITPDDILDRWSNEPDDDEGDPSKWN